MQPLAPRKFEELVGQALDDLPAGMVEPVSNLVLVVEDEHTCEPDLLGLYEGVPLTERDVYSGALPDRVTLYRIPLCLHAEDLDDLAREVRVTVVHELAHHMGIAETRLHELGWG